MDPQNPASVVSLSARVHFTGRLSLLGPSAVVLSSGSCACRSPPLAPPPTNTPQLFQLDGNVKYEMSCHAFAHKLEGGGLGEESEYAPPVLGVGRPHGIPRNHPTDRYIFFSRNVTSVPASCLWHLRFQLLTASARRIDTYIAPLRLARCIARSTRSVSDA